jgi:hypothetical protein
MGFLTLRLDRYWFKIGKTEHRANLRLSSTYIAEDSLDRTFVTEELDRERSMPPAPPRGRGYEPEPSADPCLAAQLLVKVTLVFAVVAVLEVTVTVMLDGQPGFAPIPETSPGVERSVVVPSPRSPFRFRPQHLAPPAVVKAQVW